MNEKLHRELIQYTAELRTIIAGISTIPLVNKCALLLLLGPDRVVSEHRLHSPYKQLFFLMGQALTIQEPGEVHDFTQAEWRRTCDLLTKIFDQYGRMFLPEDGDFSSIDAHWKKTRDVAMPAFLHYFNSATRMASTEQLRRQIADQLVPFDPELQKRTGLTASTALNIANWVTETLQRTVDELFEARDAVLQAGEPGSVRAEGVIGAREGLRGDLETVAHRLRSLELLERSLRLFKLPISSVASVFGADSTSAFLSLFAARRGGHTFDYRDDPNPAEARPVFLVESETLMFPSANALYLAILDQMSDCLLKSSSSGSFLKRRDNQLEQYAEELLSSFFGSEAQIYSKAFETATSQYEHDLVIVWNRRLFIVECKATPVKAPFRDPDRSFSRIKRAFKSDKGIQKAYDQAKRIRRSLAQGRPVTLYDERGLPLTRLEPEAIDRVFCVCVTAEDFGPLAAHLALLLEKSEAEEYPWAVSIQVLEEFLDALTYRGWGPDRLCDYLGSVQI